MTRVVFHPEAEAEMTASARWYDERCPGLGRQFLAEIRAAIERIAASPESWGMVTEGIRRHLVHRFPFGILYRPEPERNYVLAVMHLHREPEYWKHRI
jgi:plasmid stabilization system protein ParE